MRIQGLWAVLGQLIIVGFTANSAHAFPEMVRHGYGACTACHVSPNGGGVLTRYGREISGVVMSAAGGREKSVWAEGGGIEHPESAFLYKAVGLPDWLLGGGDIRLNRVQYSDGTNIGNRLILMQLDLEAAAFYKKFAFVGSVGRDENEEVVFSRRHYLRFAASDLVNFRIGKFMHAFGINTPDHIIATKQGLGWDQGTETYNAELSLINEEAEVFLTAMFTRPGAVADHENGYALRASRLFAAKYKVGMSVFGGSRSSDSRFLFGPFAMLGFTKKWTLLTETDFQRLTPNSTRTADWGLASYNRLDYEVLQGLHTYVTYEALRPKFADGSDASISHGAGIQFFPRPHFELNASWRRTNNVGADSSSDLYFLMAHFYL